MTKTVVIGAGLAGQAAAREASSTGAEVALIERSPSLPLRKDAWRQLISGEVKLNHLEKEAELMLGRLASAITRFSESVEGIDFSKRRLTTSRGAVPFDTLVIASGSAALKESFQGSSKRNVHEMGTPDSFAQLAARVTEFSTVAVSGTNPLAIGVADALVKLGRRVTLFAPGGAMTSTLNESIRSLLEDRIRGNGVTMVDGRVEGVAGVGKVEAILSGGSVVPCEALVLFPRSSPNPVNARLTRGRAGGILVDSEMKTSQLGVYAAGDCAEVRIGATSLPMMYSSSAELMGEVAGINSAGGVAHARLSGVGLHRLFGLDVCHAGVTLREARSSGADVLEAVATLEGDGAMRCSILFGRRDRAVLGVQIAGSRAAQFAGEASMAVSGRVRLEDLTYHDVPYLPAASSDKSPLATAARVGVTMVSK